MHSIKYLTRIPCTLNGIKTLKLTQYRRFLCTKHFECKNIEKSKIQFIDKPESEKPESEKPESAEFQIDWDDEMQAIYEDEKQENSRSVLAPVEDESKYYAEPMLRPSFHLAGYVQKSKTLQQLMKLGVSINYIERKERHHFAIRLDFERDVEGHIRFLTENVGVDISEIGNILTKNIYILKSSIDDLQTRVNYLMLKRFSLENIARIVTKNPYWLSFSTRRIDRRLGYFQNEFRLTGKQVRALTLEYPRIITANLDQVKESTFSIREECCFEKFESRELLLKCPQLYLLRMYFDFKLFFIFYFN